MSVTVVVPTFNRASDLRHTLQALLHQTVRDFFVIVVDNSSTDNTALVIEEYQPSFNGRLRYRVKEPKGPASARNLGLSIADTAYVLFLDSDVELKADWIELALQIMDQDRKLGAIGGQIRYDFDRDRLNAYGGAVGRFGLAWDVLEGSKAEAAVKSEERVWVNCSAMIARTDACRKVKGFDETFFYGYEDSDLGWKLNLIGCDVKVFPCLIAYHSVEPVAGGSNPVIVFHYCKNRLRSLLKNSDRSRLGLRLFYYAVYTVLDGVVRGPRIPKIKALLWNLTNLKDTLKLRRELQDFRMKTDKNIFGMQELRWFPPTRLNGQRRRSVQGGDTSSKCFVNEMKIDDRV